VRLGSRQFTAYDTPGHARHHLVFFDQASGDLFTGDAAGVALPGSRYVRAPTPPPEFDPPAWHGTIARMRDLRANRLLLTHYGAHTWVDELLTQLDQRIDAVVDLVRAALNDGVDEQGAAELVRKRVAADLAMVEGPARSELMELIAPTTIHARGIVRYVNKEAR
jgi:glyoxylase-like metal-dependent hydrolase (beta-lactamase superfamily II)